MNNAGKPNAHWSIWMVGVFSLIWHLMGCANYLFQATMSPDTLAGLSAAQQAVISDRPAWATSAFAIAVFGGLLGSILLLLRKRLSLFLFLIALIGVIVSMIPLFGIVNSGVEISTFERIMYLALTPLVGAFLLWFTRLAMRRGWVGDAPANI